VNSTDKALIRRAREGDDAAWLEIVSQHQEAVFRLAYLMLGNADDAEDVAQEVFIKAMKHLGRFDDERPLWPWLLQITRNTARNRYRGMSRYREALSKVWLRQTVQPSPLVEDAHAAQARSQRLWQAIRQMKTQDQEVIYLRYFLEIPVAEAAEILGTAEGTVKSRLSRALGRLKDVIEAEFPDLVKD